MANLTFTDYISTTLAYANENRDNPSANRKWRESDVKAAINCSRHRMLRKVLGGVYRNQDVMNATAGDITPPADFFNEGIVRFKPANGKPRVLTNQTARDMDIDKPTWKEDEPGEPSYVVWDLKTTGMTVRLHPQPRVTVANGLIWDYSARLVDLSADSDTCPVMNLFPEFQYTLIQAGALWQLYMLEGGEGDDQIAKWRGVFEMEIKELNAMVNGLFVSNRQMVGRSN